VTVKQRIGVVPQVNNLDRSLTAKEILVFHAEYFGVPKQKREQHADDLLKRFRVDRARRRKGEWLFRRHGAAAEDCPRADAQSGDSFSRRADDGLDPQSRRMLWDLLNELNQKGLTILLTTHYMEEADQLCQRAAIVDHGKVLALDSPTQSETQRPGRYLVELQSRGNLPDSFVTSLQSLPGVCRGKNR
jgi:ABC-2 type transport system ATP-binding protein